MHTMSSPTLFEGRNMTHFIPQDRKRTTPRPHRTSSPNSPVCLAARLQTRTTGVSRGPMLRTSLLTCLTRYEFSLKILRGCRLNFLAKLLRPEVERHTPWWSYLGAACGGGETARYKHKLPFHFSHRSRFHRGQCTRLCAWCRCR